MDLNIIYEDNHIIVINKGIGELVQPDQSGSLSLEEKVKQYIKVKYNKPGEVFLGVVHRIDRPTSGVVVMARTSKALVRLNEQLRSGGFHKEYLTILESPLPKKSDHLVGHLSRNSKTNKSHISSTPQKDSKVAELKYEYLGATVKYHLAKIELLTGRHHQIRAQLSTLGCPIKGDLKYGAKRSNKYGGIALHSYKLTLTHPVTKEQMTLTATPPAEEVLWGELSQYLKNLKN